MQLQTVGQRFHIWMRISCGHLSQYKCHDDSLLSVALGTECLQNGLQRASTNQPFLRIFRSMISRSPINSHSTHFVHCVRLLEAPHGARACAAVVKRVEHGAIAAPQQLKALHERCTHACKSGDEKAAGAVAQWSRAPLRTCRADVHNIHYYNGALP